MKKFDYILIKCDDTKTYTELNIINDTCKQYGFNILDMVVEYGDMDLFCHKLPEEVDYLETISEDSEYNEDINEHVFKTEEGNEILVVYLCEEYDEDYE